MKQTRRAPRLSSQKVGLALGSGVARGLAHIGVLEVLQREGIPVDVIAGTSAGSAIGALYAQGKDAEMIKGRVEGMGWRQIVSLVDLAFPKTGFIEGSKVKKWLKGIIGDVAFEDLKKPLACIAADIMTGEEVVIDRGSVLEAVMVSISMPVIFSVVKWKNRYLVDGAVVNPVPVDVLKRMGADIVIAVNVIPSPGRRIHQAEEFRKPNIISIIMQSIYIGSYSLVEASLEGADIVIEPEVAHIGTGDFHRAKECIVLGEKAAQEAIPGIKKLLGI